ncbi:hypothetical protein [Clostridium gasigenes]|uniref:hypothetical protein n=1 Tax=Clostridium gasigenes TaxID=94869 RepID=UPI001C0BFD28|nr:hypothetical protein [Clostridium gasigenes]MBU3104318.1 hypothetical protein [Clostridium gasigenes]
MSKDIVFEFLERLNEQDPPHALMLIGVNSASKWLKSIKLEDRKIIYNYMENELKQNGDLPIKELIIKVLKQVGGSDSLELIDKIITEGEAIHGKYLVADALNVKSKLLGV